jgi:hypothetical protein
MYYVPVVQYVAMHVEHNTTLLALVPLLQDSALQTFVLWADMPERLGVCKLVVNLTVVIKT